MADFKRSQQKHSHSNRHLPYTSKSIKKSTHFKNRVSKSVTHPVRSFERNDVCMTASTSRDAHLTKRPAFLTVSHKGDDDSYSDSEDDLAPSDAQEDAERYEVRALKSELADMSFEELQTLKEKVGTKVYNEAVFGNRSNLRPTSKRKIFSRTNKNRPQEISSKFPVKRLGAAKGKSKQLIRDPRFDDLSGEYDETMFQQSYNFISDIKDKEKTTLQKKIKKVKDPTEKEKLKYILKRMTQQENESKRKEVEHTAKVQTHKNEREMVKQGKKPYYMKKSDQRMIELAEKFRELKKTNSMDKYLNKKRKKNASKERRHLPYNNPAL